MDASRLKPIQLLFTLLVTVAASHWALAGGLFDPDFDPDDFTTPRLIVNPYWPLLPGNLFLYFTDTEDGCEWNIVQVTHDDTVEIAEVDVVVVLDIEWLDESEDCDEGDYDLGDYNPLTPRNPANFPEDGVLTEFTFDWYAQDDDGNVWYLGEDTLSFDWDECEGAVKVTDFGPGCPDGSFTAGEGDPAAEAGIVMLGDPSPGDFYRQEYDEDNAEDWGKVLRLFKVDGADCLKTKEWTPLERGAIEHKYYCMDEEQDFPGLYLIENVSGGPKEWTELVDSTEY